MNNIVTSKNTPVAGRRPTGFLHGELYFNFGDRTIGCVDANGIPVDIANAIAVGATAPEGPVPGMLWFNIGTNPAVLQVFAGAAAPEPWITVTASLVIATEQQAIDGDDNEAVMTPLRVRQAIAAQAAAVSVGDAAPAEPSPGQLWFKTTNPVGLFIWYQDADSSQWVQASGGGGSEFASTAEARAGMVADKVMSPALVRALSGSMSVSTPIAVAGHTFSGIPPEATEIDLSFDFLGANSAAAHFIDVTVNTLVTDYLIHRVALANGVPVAGGDLVSTAIRCEVFANSLFAHGGLRLVRNPFRWGVDGKWRSGPNHVSIVGATGGPGPGGGITSVRLVPSVALALGAAHLRWRI